MIHEYGLIGYPLSHSFSQKYFTEKFQREDIANAVFNAFPIPSIDDLPQLLKTHPLLKGFCITIPYKRDIIKYLTHTTAAVNAMNACNCVCIKEGKLYGYNTDVTGFELSFIKQLKPHHTKALILGTGGGASAVEYVLSKLNIAYRFVSRSKADNVFGYDELSENIIKDYTVIINCTPLGMYPNVNDAPSIPYHLFTPQHYLFDLVYNPSKTKFLSLGEEHGAAIQNGYEMLVLQAEENWKLWNEDNY